MMGSTLAALAAVAVALSTIGVAAQEGGRVELAVREPWARAAGPGESTAVYLTVHNSGTVADHVVAADAPGVAQRAEFQSYGQESGVMRMRTVSAIEVPAGGSVDLSPAGVHVFLIGLKAPLRPGVTFPLTLVFEKAGSVTVEVAVVGM